MGRIVFLLLYLAGIVAGVIVGAVKGWDTGLMLSVASMCLGALSLSVER